MHSLFFHPQPSLSTLKYSFVPLFLKYLNVALVPSSPTAAEGPRSLAVPARGDDPLRVFWRLPLGVPTHSGSEPRRAYFFTTGSSYRSPRWLATYLPCRLRRKNLSAAARAANSTRVKLKGSRLVERCRQRRRDATLTLLPTPATGLGSRRRSPQCKPPERRRRPRSTSRPQLEQPLAPEYIAHRHYQPE